MLIEFTKMHGLGNDFMVIDLVTQRLNLTTEFVKLLGDRHLGIGFDQLLIVEPPSQPDVDFRYRIFNKDGSEVQQCGNGARCFARFVQARKLSFKQKIRVETASGIITLSTDNYGWVQVDMGKPKFEPEQIPFAPKAITKVQNSYRLDVDGTPVTLYVANMGNPHAVIKVDDVLTAEVGRLGKAIESHPAFPERVNVGFMQVMNDRHIRLRVYERGVGETKRVAQGRVRLWLQVCVRAGLMKVWISEPSCMAVV